MPNAVMSWLLLFVSSPGWLAHSSGKAIAFAPWRAVRSYTQYNCKTIWLCQKPFIADGYIQQHRFFQSTSRLHLNRLLFDVTELDDSQDEKQDPTAASDDGIVTVTIPQDDYRTIHVAKILGLHNGDTVRAGIVLDPDADANSTPTFAGLVTDTATVQWIPEGKIKKTQPLAKSGKPPGSLRILLHHLQSPAAIPDVPAVSLLLALPRPLQLQRLLPMMAQMGVHHVILTQAQKVPRDYFGSHLLRQPAVLRQGLVQGLCQAGVDVRLPRVTVVKNLRHFLHDDLDRLFPTDTYARVLAHPERVVVQDGGTHRTVEPVVGRFEDNVQFPSTATSGRRQVLLAVGPEGGWAEPEELDLLRQQYNFQTVTLGPRVLRTDVAVVSLMALAHEACRVTTSDATAPSTMYENNDGGDIGK